MLLWPDNYVKLDSSNLLVHPDYAPLFENNGWTTTDSVIQASFRGTIMRSRDRDDGWENVQWRLDAESTSPVSFLKRHRFSKPATSPASHEAEAVRWCQLTGAPCMEIIAVGNSESGVANEAGQKFHSFFLSKQVGEGLSVYQSLQNILNDKADRQQEIQDLLEITAFTAARLHSGHLYHNDCHFQHFYVDRSERETVARLIDLQGIRRISDPHAGYYQWLKDMGQLRHSLIRLQIYRDYNDFWYDCYEKFLTDSTTLRWLKNQGRKRISLRGDTRLFRRIFLNLVTFKWKRAQMLIHDRVRAA
ncbi:lipopolysaccharide kinase InaA family protein [Planctomicrobium sp. SH668]|uniref:lipopolysaccharide kinase InaA family protein n=1 Tax=Planctomicrobium sp. SH668 TaxID=3448126 RepID=UPI003F5B24E2